jgi:hypothetical protein
MRIVGTGSGGYWGKAHSLPSSGVYTLSVWMKGTGTVNLKFQRDGGAFENIGSTAFALTSEWVRYQIVASLPDVINPWRMFISGVESGDNFEAWGFQCESGSGATAYIPTTAQIGIATDIISQTEGTLYAEFTEMFTPPAGVFPTIIRQTKNASPNDDILAYHTPTANTFNYKQSIAGSSVFDSVATGNTVTAGTPHKIAIAYKAGSHAAVSDGATPYTNSAAGVPSTRRINIGSGSSGTAARYKEVRYYNQRKTDAELTRMTTL